MAKLAHPERPLSKGYVRVTSRDGRTLTHSADARDAARLTLHFGDGAVDASVDGTVTPRQVEPARRKPYIPLQPGLFDPAED
jgi:exodeoxyribonuclease VII large subunit